MRLLTGLGVALLGVALHAQTPQPFPRPQPQQPPPTAPTAPARSQPASPPAAVPAPQAPVTPAPVTATTAVPGAPTEATLGVPLYPSAVYLTSYDAGRGQRFYIFGVQVPYAEMVNYYRSTLKQRGEQLFDSPGTHQFETARYRESDMAFPPSVTVKDYASGGSAGYPNPKAGAQPDRFPTLIQIVATPVAGAKD